MRSVALRVFCPRESATIDVDVCQRCSRLEAIDVRDDHPSVTCDPGSPSVGRLPVGALVRSAVLCVRADLPLEQLRSDDRAAEVIPVIDDSERYIGAIIHGRSTPTPPPPDSGVALLGELATVEDAMEHVPTVHERDDVLTAAAAMTSQRARCVAVVNDEAAVVGLLDDLALLASVARERADAEVVKQCSCGRVYSRRQWAELSIVGSMVASDGNAMELRNCTACGSTMAVAVQASEVA